MTTDLVTYYGQTEKINELVDNYGAYLEKLDRGTKLLLRMTLAHFVFIQEQKSHSAEYTLTDALKEALFVRFRSDFIPKDLSNVCSVLKGLTADEAETLLEALQHQIRWGNAQKLTS
ncbi:MAG: hypothetical protein RMY28_031245 [Nostoc sp. ChiSLP01]|nr:hypothetical protein [Nostoc sp. CmiSLP01]MDZ8288440.1 hypothetical protein [Nostoc sp. ChiSLP01]